MKKGIILGIIGLIGAVAIWQVFLNNDDFNLPSSGETTTEEVIIDSTGQIVDSPDKIMDQDKIEKGIFETKEIMVTNGTKHSVPLEEIRGGGPPKDGIPSIDDPKFISISEAGDWLDDNDPGIAFSLGNTYRFYPYQILVWHELVNDIIPFDGAQGKDGKKILVSYCPLCLSGFVFDPIVKGEQVEFGTSGKLWKSNLVMYDRKTDSLWSQILGEAIVGEMTGTKLKVLPSDQVLFNNWKKQFPNGQVLSRDTGASRIYGSSPYGDYFSATDFAVSLAGPKDDRLENDAFVFGIVINGRAKAYSTEAVKKKGVVEDTFEGTNLILRYDKNLDVIRMFKKLPNGAEERINPFSNFWFSWAAIHPGTELYK